MGLIVIHIASQKPLGLSFTSAWLLTIRITLTMSIDTYDLLPQYQEGTTTLACKGRATRRPSLVLNDS